MKTMTLFGYIRLCCTTLYHVLARTRDLCGFHEILGNRRYATGERSMVLSVMAQA